jgi:alkylation response protein AidB-like acyl-CoA dehydrogenase
MSDNACLQKRADYWRRTMSSELQSFPERSMDSLYHDMLSPEDVLSIRSEVRAFCDKKVASVAWDIGHREESVENFPRELFKAMADAGLFRIPFNTDGGGRGLTHPAAATAVTIEELSYYSNSVAAIFDVHCILTGHALTYGSEELKSKYLEALLAGEKIGSFATSEAETSTDLSVDSLVTEAVFKDDHIVVSGHKRWITNSPVASFVILLCKDGDRMTEVVVDLDSPGVRVGQPDKKMGNHGQLTADIHFDAVKVPLTNVLGKRGDGLKIALQVLAYGRIGIAATGVGMAQSVFDHSAFRLKSRRAFKRPLGSFQHWQFLMADRATQIENARSLYLKAALRMDSGVAFPEPEAAMAKAYATDLACSFARDGVQIFGGYGFISELAEDGSRYKVEEVYRDSKIAEIYEGTNEIQKWVIARTIFGKEITG